MVVASNALGVLALLVVCTGATVDDILPHVFLVMTLKGFR